ncbi:hypothetical protein X474_08900 [Dethiosulfatarculus sandiegensis]|uniref:Uncharacterized protein n=1 Tax=Dethiosulfatarculus sandiegensis TaxID=1429043 RepID=A0A0D2JXQ4_9BACT|nr:hypothetical protein X474_08900 [Dethiosulfatarculus sandiegensis]
MAHCGFILSQRRNSRIGGTLWEKTCVIITFNKIRSLLAGKACLGFAGP